jgi:hypothetical protein
LYRDDDDDDCDDDYYYDDYDDDDDDDIVSVWKSQEKTPSQCQFCHHEFYMDWTGTETVPQ